MLQPRKISLAGRGPALAVLLASLILGPGTWAQTGQEATGQEAAAGTATEETTPPEPGQTADATLTLDGILANHLDRRLPDTGVRSVRASGQLVFMGLQLPVKIVIARPRSSRLDADMAGTPMILAYDGESAWTVSPMQGFFEPEQLGEDAEESIALFADFIWGMLADRESSGIEVELAGIETIGNDQTYALHLGGTVDGKPIDRRLYLGGEDFLEHKLSLETVFLGQLQTIDAVLGDYRDVAGLQVPHDIQLFSSGAPLAQVVLSQVETNVEIDPKTFEMPPPPPPTAEGESDPPGAR